MSAEESRYAEDWFRKGEADLRSAERLYDEPSSLTKVDLQRQLMQVKELGGALRK